LHEVVASGEVQTNLVVLPPEARDSTRSAEPLGGKRLGSKRRAAPRVADLARELERRLLVQAVEIHTSSGAHAKVLQSWPRWSAEVQLQAAAARDSAEVELP